MKLKVFLALGAFLVAVSGTAAAKFGSDSGRFSFQPPYASCKTAMSIFFI
jgi:hypothetical protein